MICCKLLELLDHHDDLLAELEAEQRHADERGVLVAVADDQAPRVLLQRQRREELRLAADFQAEVKRLAGVENFFHHFAELVDLDRENAAIIALVIEFGDRAAKREVDGLDAVAENVLKPDEERKTQAARTRFVDDLEDVDGTAIFLKRLGHNVAFGIDSEISTAPTIDIVRRDCGINVPIVFHFSGVPNSEAIRIIIQRGKQSRTALKNFPEGYSQIWAACFSSPCG